MPQGFDLLLLVAAFALMLPHVLARTWSGVIHYLPSTGWFFLMVLPFCIEYPLFFPETRGLQSYNILLVGLVVFLSDLMADRIIRRDSKNLSYGADILETQASSLRLAKSMGLAFAVISVAHLLTIDRIPLFSMLYDHANPLEVSAIRNAFSRDAAIPDPLRYLFSFSPYILALPATLLFIKYKKYTWAFGLFAWNVFYAVSSTAKGPLFAGIIILVIGLIHIMHSTAMARAVMRAAIVVCFCSFLMACFASAFLNKNGILSHFSNHIHMTEKPRHAQEKAPFANSLGDFMRAINNNTVEAEASPVLRKLDYLLYRIVFTPMEVSARWYEYFYHYPIAEGKIDRLIADSRSGKTIHPANAVGLWAYADRFPDKYSQQVYAYASIDADSHARFGWTGFMFVMIAYGFFRALIAFLNDNKTLTRGVFYGTAVGLLTILLSAASIQAMLVAYGLVVFPLILIAIRMTNRPLRGE